MTDRPVTIPPTTTIADAHRAMRERKVRHLPVLVRDGTYGIVSDRDLHLFESLNLGDSEQLLVGDVMVEDPREVAPSTPLDEVVRTMADDRFDAVVVKDKGAIVGIFTAVDACYALSQVLRDATR